jgi:uncharacterized protein (DUF488 family)
MTYPFYTIGHGTRPIEKFIDLLQSVKVTLVADVRTVPRSRTNPQYKPVDVNAFWQNESFHNYADYAMGDGFRAGLSRLRDLGRARCCAIMCAETVWWRCHRRIITDYLLAAGETVFHVLGAEKIELAAMNKAARLQSSGSLVYPAEPEAPTLF